MIKPLGDRVLVEPVSEEERSPGGVILPDTAKEKPQQGKVIAVGSGRKEGDKVIPLEVKVGDRVIYSKYGGTEIKHEGKEYLILKEEDILGIITK